MHDLEIRCQEKNIAKRTTQFGALVQKLCSFEVLCTLGNDLIISPQPFIRCSWSWTFWKWERKIFNFNVGQNFIWSFFDVGKLSWSWSKNLPFLETFKLQVTFHFGKLLIWLQNLQGRCLTCWITFFGTWMKCFKPFFHLLALSWLAVDFYRPKMTWSCTVDFEPSTLGQIASKWYLGHVSSLEQP